MNIINSFKSLFKSEDNQTVKELKAKAKELTDKTLGSHDLSRDEVNSIIQQVKGLNIAIQNAKSFGKEQQMLYNQYQKSALRNSEFVI